MPEALAVLQLPLSSTVWFLLMGAIPLIRGIEFTHDLSTNYDQGMGKVTMAIRPWVPIQAVQGEYRKAQWAMLGARHHRNVDQRALTLFRFVEARIDDEGNPPAVLDLMREWNASQQTEWSFDDERSFWRTYTRALRNICFPLPLNQEGASYGPRTS